MNRRFARTSIGLLMALAAIGITSMLSGQIQTDLHTVIAILFDAKPDDAAFAIIELRAPRFVLAAAIGAALGMAGALLQGIARNPLVEPGIIGVNAGAALTAVVLIVALRDVPGWVLPPTAFAGASLTAFIVFALAWRDGELRPMRLVLTGVGVAAIASAFIGLLTISARIADTQRAYVWLAGSLHGRSWLEVQSMGLWLILLTPAALFTARSLDALSLGSAAAHSLGVRVGLIRTVAVVIAAGLSASSVSVVGPVAFVGLIGPHIARVLAGSMHVSLLPISALAGAALTALSDLIGRRAIAPDELPVGVIVAIVGAPYFLWLMSRQRYV